MQIERERNKERDESELIYLHLPYIYLSRSLQIIASKRALIIFNVLQLTSSINTTTTTTIIIITTISSITIRARKVSSRNLK